MPANDVPSPESVLVDLEPFFELAYPALEAATDAAVKVFERENLPIDLGLHAYHTRVRAGNWLSSEVIEGTGFRKVDVGSGGLYFISESYELRLLKADHVFSDETDERTMALPAPHSHARSQYYNQPMFAGMGPAYLQPLARPKLVGLWDIDRNYQLSEIGLALPRAGALRRGESEHHWLVPVPYVGLVGTFGDDSARETLEDLELPRRPERKKTGTDDVLGD